MGATKSKWVGRFEQALGKTLQSVGRWLDDREIIAQGRGKEREGRFRKSAAMAILRLKGNAERFAGQLRATLGRIADNPRWVRDGDAQAFRGRARAAANVEHGS